MIMNYKESEIYKAHKELGFPKIENLIQCQMLVSHNFEPIINIIPQIKDKGFPFGLLNDYITISRNEFKAYLKQINYIQNQLDAFTKTYDGFWLRKTSDGFILFERERGEEFGFREIKSEEEVLEIYCDILGWCCK